MTSSGAPFWSGPKRCPKAVKFNPNEDLHVDFVVAAANLYAFNYGIESCRNRSVILDGLKSVEVPEFVPKSGVKISVTDQEAQNASADVDDIKVEKIVNNLPKPEDIKDLKVYPCDFEKVDKSLLYLYDSCYNYSKMIAKFFPWIFFNVLDHVNYSSLDIC